MSPSTDQRLRRMRREVEIDTRWFIGPLLLTTAAVGFAVLVSAFDLGSQRVQESLATQVVETLPPSA